MLKISTLLGGTEDDYCLQAVTKVGARAGLEKLQESSEQGQWVSGFYP